MTKILNHAFPVNPVSIVDTVFAKNVHQEKSAMETKRNAENVLPANVALTISVNE